MAMMHSRVPRPATAGLLWLLLFGVLFSCLCPSTMFVGVFASTLQADVVAGIVDDYLCPEGSTGEIITYLVIPRRNTTDYEMQCVTAGGEIVRAPSPDYAFYWLGALAVGVSILAIILALLLMIPAGVWIGRRQAKSIA
jgi:hypothetical protein